MDFNVVGVGGKASAASGANQTLGTRLGAPGLVSTDDRDERWFEWKDGCYRACEKPRPITGRGFLLDGMTSR